MKTLDFLGRFGYFLNLLFARVGAIDVEVNAVVGFNINNIKQR